MRSIKIPEKRSIGIFLRVTPSNKAYLDQVAAETDCSLSVIVDTLIGNARAEEALTSEARPTESDQAQASKN